MITPLSADAARTWHLLAERIASEPDPRVKANLAMVARHVEEEVRGDVPALMTTMVPEPAYRVWGASDSPGPVGRHAVEAHYEAMAATGKNRLEFEVSRVVADAGTVITEGVFRHAYTGETLMGRSSSTNDTLEPGGWYLIEYQALIVWRISPDGLIEGEDIYAGEAPRVLGRLAPGELPHLGPADREERPSRLGDPS